MRFYRETNQRFVRDGNGMVVGFKPVSVREDMAYTEGGVTVPFSYDTRRHSEQDVDKMLDKYPSFVSRLFRNVMSYISLRLWRGTA